MVAANSAIHGPDDRVLVIERTFDAPREMVFEAWMDFNHAKNWMGAPGHPMKEMIHDRRVGGKWHNVMRHEDRELGQGGVYREIDPPGRLAFTFKWDDRPNDPGRETIVEIDFREAGKGKTLMIFKQGVFNTQSNRDGHGQGWTRAFNAFDQFLAERKKAA